MLRRVVLGTAAALVAALLLSVLWRSVGDWKPERQEVANLPMMPPAMPPAALAKGWQVQPTGAAVYQVTAPDRLRLTRGELRVSSTEEHPPVLTIETPAGTATAAGTDFYIGTHEGRLTPLLAQEPDTMNRMTRVLVLAGVVTLATVQGSVSGGPGSLLAAEPKEAPVKDVVTSNSDFALDLYHRLADANAGKNVFFSPYSLSSVLAMTAEGARGETAEQMGKALHFPAAARRVGDDAQLLPWNTALINTGMATLNQRFNGSKTVPPEVREKIERLRKELAESNRNVRELEKAQKWGEANTASTKAQRLANELNGLLSQVDQYELRVVNALWGEKSYPFRQAYLDAVNNSYKTGGVFPMDFRGNPEKAREHINATIAEQTKDRIKDLLPPRSIDDLTRLVLTNAIYFKGEWADPFPANETKDQDFLLPGGNKVKVPLMHHWMNSARYAAWKGDGNYFATPHEIVEGENPQVYPDPLGFTMLELPYKGGELTMVLLVPQDPGGLSVIEKQLTSANLQTWCGKLEQRTVDGYVPRFKLDTDYGLIPALRAMGMVRAFVDPREPNGAQFDGMSASSNPADKLYITGIFHKAFVEVNEKGTEAAAASAVVMAAPSAAAAPRRTRPFIPTFRADKPFLFLIRDKQTGTVLFLGRMTNPK